MKYLEIGNILSPQIVSWSGTVEVHQLVLQFLPHRLRDHLRQLEVVDLLLPDHIELGALGPPEVSLMLVVPGQIHDEHQPVSHILGVNVAPRAGLCFTGVSVNGHLATLVEM